MKKAYVLGVKRPQFQPPVSLILNIQPITFLPVGMSRGRDTEARVHVRYPFEKQEENSGIDFCRVSNFQLSLFSKKPQCMNMDKVSGEFQTCDLVQLSLVCCLLACGFAKDRYITLTTILSISQH
jgi:hypothetical protein